MAIISTASSGVSVFHRFFIFFTIIFIIITVFANGVVESIKEKNIMPLINDVGGKLLLSTYKLEQSSEKIIVNGIDFNKGFTNNLLLILDIFGSLVIIYYWLKLFSFIISRSFISNTDNYFANWFIAFLIFFIFQIIIILILLYENISVFGIDLSKGLSNIMLPFNSFYMFIKTIPIFLSPITHIANNIESNNNLSSYLNISNISH